ncbi:MAG: hypothetical protein HY051_06105 [Candidatus Aenigmarchaeota archaeon]|nr:hypothetical protein [Candidatus Aenigmarchaeota archaeon]
MKKHAEILSPRLFFASLVCIAMAFYWKFRLASLVATWIGIYLYTQKEDHERSMHYSYITLFLAVLSLVYSFF